MSCIMQMYICILYANYMQRDHVQYKIHALDAGHLWEQIVLVQVGRAIGNGTWTLLPCKLMCILLLESRIIYGTVWEVEDESPLLCGITVIYQLRYERYDLLTPHTHCFMQSFLSEQYL